MPSSTPNIKGLEQEAGRLVQALASRAGFETCPSVLVYPSWYPSGRWAGALADVHVIWVNPRLLAQSASFQQGMLAHELGHLWHGHGRGELWKAVWWTGLAVLVLVPAIWYLAGDLLPALVIGFALVFVWVSSVAQRRLVTSPAEEAQADEFARQLVGDDVWGAYVDERARSGQTRR